MERADVAMYRAKVAHVPLAYYEREFDEAGNGGCGWPEELKKAIWSNQLVLHYQPQLDLRIGAITGVEALVGGRHPTQGRFPPGKLRPVAEEAGRLGALVTHWVLVNALEQCRAWHADGQPVRVSVNVSVTDLLDRHLPERIASLLREHRLPPGSFVMEITESTMIEEVRAAPSRWWPSSATSASRSRLTTSGAGVTSLAYLGGLAVAELKLDRRFIAPLHGPHQSRDVELVRATIALGHALRLRVVAEGVESTETIELLTRLGCDLAQGDCIDKPSHPALVSLEDRPVAAAGLAPEGDPVAIEGPVAAGNGAGPRAHGADPVIARRLVSEALSAGGLQQAAAGRHHPQLAGKFLGRVRRQLGHVLGPGRFHCSGQLRPTPRHRGHARGRAPARGRGQLGRFGLDVGQGEVTKRLVRVTGVDGAAEGAFSAHPGPLRIQAPHPRPPLARGPRRKPPLRIARSVSGVRRVVGYGGRFHGLGAIVP